MIEHKTHKKQYWSTYCNVLSKGEYSAYFRAWSELECNGFVRKQDELIKYVAKQIGLWVNEEMQENEGSLITFEERACEAIDSFIQTLQEKAYLVRDLRATDKEAI